MRTLMLRRKMFKIGQFVENSILKYHIEIPNESSIGAGIMTWMNLAAIEDIGGILPMLVIHWSQY